MSVYLQGGEQMATETNLTKVNVFPSEASYETNKSGLGSGELSIVKMENSFFSGMEDYSIGSNNTPNGYIKYANGLMVQWGKQLVQNDGNRSITFNQPFSSTVYNIIADIQRETGSGAGASYTYHSINSDVTTTGFSVKAKIEDGGSNIYINWIALGDWS